MIRPETRLATHEVLNQPDPPAVPCDPWADDPVLRDHLAAEGGDPGPPAALGAAIARRDAWRLGEAARRHGPALRAFDRGGRRLDEVEFHPAYHALMEMGLTAGYAARPWTGGAGGHAAHAAMVYLLSQAEPGVCCPMTMTYAAVPALRADAELEALWRPRLAAAAYDPRLAPVGDKTAATMGMAMTEKGGGSDLRGTTTRAEPADGAWRLTGHKWFCSAPMSDGFLTLAQAPGGLSCFVVPRWLPDGGRNAVRLVRLKDKCGNRANASAEIEYEGALAHRLGPEGEGVRTILEMVHHTRLDTAMAPAGLMRAALREALWWCEGRTAFQRRLIDQPLMRATLADLALDWEGALALGLRVAGAFDRGERAFARIGVALAKFLANKRAVPVIGEAMEALGGMGYVEDTPLPMLYREAPLNGIWEGSGSVIALDIRRTLGREPAARAALEEEWDAARGTSRTYDAALRDLRARWPGVPEEAEARAFAERAALLLVASVLLRRAPAAVGEGYAAARLGEGRALVAGAGPAPETEAILGRLGAR
ncbi:acyl-CoA dehydrogenase family protein [Rubellimicrobium sp. CFH 75288]|uniref:acyl-CoA dehydrogenase family protein n=1 Tax=Rubellimicrobium sp. CFH 75288 TaxID=2697034 RepID=UPI0014133900|nr:acyl-CoA dehydrogenase family protein [Rubellimicrobium sp. CFH 75288]NAZ36541.1 DNA alkylation response protein [Rubellimicrobium sp. CFH 75288]